MQIQNYEELKLGSEMFEEVRDCFDVLLQKLFKKMEDNNSDEGSIDLKLSIEIRTEWIPDPDSEGGSRQINMPIIKHKITTQVPVKDALDGSKDTGMALVYDETMKRYVLKYVSLDGQMNIFDMEQQSDERDVVDIQESIEGRTVLQIEEKSTEDSGEEPESPDCGIEREKVEDEETMDDESGNGAEDDTEAYGDDYTYDDPTEPC